MSKFKVEIKNDKLDNCFFLSVTHNGYQWSSLQLKSTDEMRQIAAALIAKADEIEGDVKCLN